MRDLRLAEQRAKAAEKREGQVLARLQAMEAVARDQPVALGQQGTGMVPLHTHTQLLGIAEQRAADHQRRVREVETEVLSLRAQVRVLSGGQMVVADQAALDGVLALLDDCCGTARTLASGGGPATSVTEVLAALDDAIATTRSLHGGAQARRVHHGSAHTYPAAPSDASTVGKLEAVATRKVPPATSPKPARKHAGPGPPVSPASPRTATTATSPRTARTALTSMSPKTARTATDAGAGRPRAASGEGSLSVLDRARSLSTSSQDDGRTGGADVRSPRTAAKSPGRLNTAFLHRLDRGMPVAGVVPLQPAAQLEAVRLAKQRRQQKEERPGSQQEMQGQGQEDGWSSDGSSSPGSGAQSGPPVPVPLPEDDLTGHRLLRPPSLTQQFARPKSTKRRLPSRRSGPESAAVPVQEKKKKPLPPATKPKPVSPSKK